MRARRRAPSFLLAAGLALGAPAAGCGDAEPRAAGIAERPAAEELLPVARASVRVQEHYTVRERFAGRVRARRESTLGFDRGGRLAEVRVDEGARVAAGDVLARLDTRSLEAERRSRAARLGEIEARLALARATKRRRERLAERESISAQALDEAVAEARALAAQREAVRAEIERIDVALALSRLEAPFDGSVTERRADEGAAISPGEPILHVLEGGALEFHIGLPPEAARSLEPERRYRVEVEGRPHPARLRTVLDTVAPDTRTVTAILRFESAEGTLRDGALGRLALERRVEARGLWLPIEALAGSRRGLWSAYALAPAPEAEAPSVRRVERRQLQLLHADSARVYVRGTLEEGDSVVAGGLHRVVPGQLVRVVEGAERE